MTKSQFCLGLTCLSVGLLACTGEESEGLAISSQQAALTAAQNSERALQGVVDAGDFLAASTSIAQSLNAFGAGESCSSSGYCDATGCYDTVEECTTDEVTEEDLEELRQDIRDSVTDLVTQLRENILIPENLEEETETSATYRLGPDVLCDEFDDVVTGGSSGTTGGTVDTATGAAAQPEYDPDCVAELERYQPRLVLTSPSEGDIDLTLQLGAGRHEPLTLALYHNSLGVRLDLGEALDLARETGEADDLQNIDALAGVLELRLLENAARDYSLELNVLEAIEVQVSDAGETVSASLGASSPASNVRLDGNTQTLSAGLDLAAFRLTGPLRAFADMIEDDDDVYISDGSSGVAAVEPEPTYHGVLDMFLAGLSGRVSYTANTDVIAFDDLGFGDQTSTIKHDGNTLLALDLNAESGRRVNLRVTPSEDGGAQITITPSFDLRVAMAFHYVADQFQDISSWVLDETLHAWFSGDAPALHVSDTGLQVAAGTLHIDSAADPTLNVTVAAGMCLGEAPEEEPVVGDVITVEPVVTDEEEPHPLLSLDAVVCE